MKKDEKDGENFQVKFCCSVSLDLHYVNPEIVLHKTDKYSNNLFLNFG